MKPRDQWDHCLALTRVGRDDEPEVVVKEDGLHDEPEDGQAEDGAEADVGARLAVHLADVGEGDVEVQEGGDHRPGRVGRVRVLAQEHVHPEKKNVFSHNWSQCLGFGSRYLSQRLIGDDRLYSRHLKTRFFMAWLMLKKWS